MSKRFNREKALPWILLAPALFLLVVVTLYPLIYSIRLSLSEFDVATFSAGSFVGFKNYVAIFKDWRLWNSLKITSIYILFTIPTELILGFVIALLFNRKGRFITNIRSILIMPMMITPVAIAIIFKLMYQTEIGIINFILESIGLEKVLWLGDVNIAIFSVGLIDIWQWTPFMFLIIFSGMRSLPIELYEAASIDRANYWQKMKYITIPLLKKVILTGLVLRFIDAIRSFDTIYVLTHGGPASSTDVLSILIYRTGFKNLNLDIAAGMSFLFLILVTLIVIFIFIRLLGLKIEI